MTMEAIDETIEGWCQEAVRKNDADEYRASKRRRYATIDGAFIKPGNGIVDLTVLGLPAKVNEDEDWVVSVPEMLSMSDLHSYLMLQDMSCLDCDDHWISDRNMYARVFNVTVKMLRGYMLSRCAAIEL